MTPSDPTSVQPLEQALAVLRDLGGVEEMQALADSAYAPPARPKSNLHVHLPPNFSAFDSVAQAVDLADAQDVRVLCASNYYDYGVYAEFVSLARQRNIFPLFGTEIIATIDELARTGVKINDPGNPGRIYLCGKGITCLDPLSGSARRLLDIIWDNDTSRMAEMVTRLADVFAQRGLDTGLTEGRVKDMVADRHGCPREAVCLQERHLAQAFQQVLFQEVPPAGRADRLGTILGVPFTGQPDDAVKVQGDIRTHLMKAGKVAFVAETFGSFDEAVQLILELGGIPCYPTLADGADPVCPFEEPVEEFIDRIKARGIVCAEFIPIRNQPEVLARYVRAVRRAGLAITGGTEHNTLSLLAMEPACVAEKPVPEDVKDIFWEGACVVAAHQFLALHHRCGFVDAQGRPNGDYNSDDERIAAFARLGAAVIQRYYETSGQA